MLHELLDAVIANRNEATALCGHSRWPKFLLKTAPDLSESEVAEQRPPCWLPEESTVYS